MSETETPQKQPDLGRLVSTWRSRRGLSLRQVADALTAEGCEKTRGAIHHYERGGGMRRDVARALVSVFGLDEQEAAQLYRAAGYVVAMDGAVNG